MPKQRAPFDVDRYEALKAQGLSQRGIAQEMGIPEATVRDNLKVLGKQQTQGPPRETKGGQTPQGPVDTLGSYEVDISPPQASPIGIPEVDEGIHHVLSFKGPPQDTQGIPPLYVHPGIPDDSEESPVGAEEIEGVYHGIPPLPLTEIQEGHQDLLSPQIVEALTTAWPDLLQMLGWWRTRQQQAHEPPAKLERATYHVAPKWIEAVRREADLSGESYAAVVNRAFAQYFAGKST